ncbi:hypothetical protein ACFQ1L_27105 [Phytohabitans flavus]|uniref:hypothetical protein n=1 Tax=Phytohabitans flavus TaxID=1076124 RepID=UPI00362BDC01
MGGFRLGVDFGTSHTVAVLRWPDGRARPLLFDGSPVLPSAVSAAPAGGLLTGRDALYAARFRPEAVELHPKRCVDDGTVLLGDAEFAVVDLVAAVLRRVADEGTGQRRTAAHRRHLPGELGYRAPRAGRRGGPPRRP